MEKINDKILDLSAFQVDRMPQAGALALAKHMLDPQEPGAFPRAEPTQVAPKLLNFSTNISTDAGEWGALVLHPNIYNTIVKYEKDTTSKTLAEWEDHYFYTDNGSVTYLQTTAVDTNDNTIPPNIDPNVDVTYAIENSSGNQPPPKRNGCPYLDGSFTFNGTDGLAITISNPGGLFASVVSMAAYSLNVTTNVLTVLDSDSVAEDPNSMAFSLIPSAGTYDNLVLRIATGASSPISFNMRVVPTNVTFTTHGHWNVLDALDIIGSDSLSSQFVGSSSVSYTHMSCVVTNVTPELYKGGKVRIAQLPGGSQFPTEPQQLFEFIDRLNNGYRTFKGGELRKGFSWNYVPEKVQDWFFEPVVQPGDWPVSSKPFLVAAWQAPATTEVTQATFDAKIRLGAEIQSPDPSLTLVTSPDDPEDAVRLYLQASARVSNVGENPDHLKRIGKHLATLARDPDFQRKTASLIRRGIRVGGKALVTALPALLGAL